MEYTREEIQKFIEDNGVTFEWDGDMRCATGRGFYNLQESNAGFGRTDEEAVIDLMNRDLIK